MKHSGFTLAELLVALVILGVIATFAIPKILVSQQDAKNKSIAKEVAGMISEAYNKVFLSTGISASTQSAQLVAHMNYVRKDTVTIIDDVPTWTTIDCSDTAQNTCLRLHNGAMLRHFTTESYGATGNNRVLVFTVDPDAKQSTVKSVAFHVRYNGHIQTSGVIPNGTVTSSMWTHATSPTDDPAWFNWN